MNTQAVILDDDTRRTLGTFFDGLTALDIFSVEVVFTDVGHRCCCEYCKGNEPDLAIDTVQLLCETGLRVSFRHDEDGLAAAQGCAALQLLPFDFEVLADAISALHYEGLFNSCGSRWGWVKFDALSRLADGGSLVETGSVDEWTCDIRDSQDTETRLWD